MCNLEKIPRRQRNIKIWSNSGMKKKRHNKVQIRHSTIVIRKSFQDLAILSATNIVGRGQWLAWVLVDSGEQGHSEIMGSVLLQETGCGAARHGAARPGAVRQIMMTPRLNPELTRVTQRAGIATSSRAPWGITAGSNHRNRVSCRCIHSWSYRTNHESGSRENSHIPFLTPLILVNSWVWQIHEMLVLLDMPSIWGSLMWGGGLCALSQLPHNFY